ncbi:MAG: SDR family oxidoreductase [Lautropia sp.]
MSAPADPRLALVVGAGGLVGGHLVERLLERGWDVVGIARRPLSHRSPRYRHLPLDVADAARCVERCAEVAGVTHLFYAARAGHRDAAAETALNVAMLRNTVDALLARASRLAHVCLVHGTKWYGSHLGPFRTPAVEEQPRHAGENWYFGQHDWLVERQRGRNWHWSTMRPHIVAGVSVGYPYNCLTTLAAYAALCREHRRPFAFPGSAAAFDAITQATDATLLADAQIWTAENPACAGQDFNVINADYFRWRHLWPAIAGFFGLEPGGPDGPALAESMRDAQPEWDALVHRHGLQPLPLSALASRSFGDFLFGTDWDVMSSMLKARRFGFDRVVGTEQSFVGHLARMRDARLIP